MSPRVFCIHCQTELAPESLRRHYRRWHPSRWPTPVAKRKYSYEWICEMLEAGRLSNEEIATEVGCNVRTVLRVKEWAGYADKVESRILSDDDIERARYWLEEDGWNYTMVRKELPGVGYDRLKSMFPGHTWTKHQNAEASAMARALNRIPDHLERRAA